MQISSKKYGGFYFDGISIVNKREINMDRLLLKNRYISGSNVFLGAVCDGVGSKADGAYASAFAVRELSGFLDELSSAENAGAGLYEKIKRINRAVVNAAEDSGLQTASTLSAIMLADGVIYIVHAGDSRIYRYKDGVLSRMTRDTVSGSGKLTSYIGNIHTDEMFFSESRYADGEIFLLCSDGLSKRVSDMAIQSITAGWDAKYKKSREKNLSKLLNRLKEEATEAGERDNITIALVLSGRAGRRGLLK